MGEPVRVLHALGDLNKGGADAFIMNIYRNIDRSKLQFDFLIRSYNNNEDLIKEIQNLGGQIYFTSSFPKHFLKNKFEVNSIIKNNYENYDTIHVHANALMYTLPLKLAKKYKITNRIIHSHSTHSANDKYYKYIHDFNKKHIYKYANIYFACSNLAGKWMFGNDKFKIIKNAIDTNKFIYNKNIRRLKRKELNLENKFVIGHVGRFIQVKNHIFILDLFKKILKQKPNTALLLVGDGELRREIENRVEKFGLENNVILTGVRSDVNELMQAMDVFLFPSLYEGLPVTLVEAQASGLPCVISDVITDEVKVTDLVESVSLKESASYWAKQVLRYSDGYERRDTGEEIKKAGFDINEVARWLENFYLGIEKV